MENPAFLDDFPSYKLPFLGGFSIGNSLLPKKGAIDPELLVCRNLKRAVGRSPNSSAREPNISEVYCVVIF